MKQSTEIKKCKYHLEIANSRGRKPVIRELDKARKLINDLLIEINSCEGEYELRKIDGILFQIVLENQ